MFLFFATSSSRRKLSFTTNSTQSPESELGIAGDGDENHISKSGSAEQERNSNDGNDNDDGDEWDGFYPVYVCGF